MKNLVTATNYSSLCAKSKLLLQNHGCEVIENNFGRPMVFDELRDLVGDVDGVIAGPDTWNDSVFRIAPKLKVIARFGVGVDNIDVEAANRRGIAVTNAPGKNANAVAEMTVGLILATMRSIGRLHLTTRQGRWDRFVGEELVGRTVGLLGFGNIAQKVAKKLGGFEVKIVAYDIRPDIAAAERLSVTFVSSDELLSHSDIVCMLLPSLKETRHFMDANAFGRMKSGAYFINTARGALVDEKALYTALDSGHLRGAGIDVYEHEPSTSDNPLFSLDNIVSTPHTAAETYETYAAVGAVTARAVLDVLAGREPECRL